jgi:signal transduction histidine kinase/DNA-binding NarL/FixJ family response regulator
MTSPLRILHLEDNPNDAELIQAMLETEGITSHVMRVETQADFVASIERGDFDLILADYTLPSFDGLSALKIASEKCPDVPFIFVSGTLGEEVAIEALKIGATDYLLKERLSKIVPSVHRALGESKERAERKRAETLLAGEKRLLEMIAKGNPLSLILDALCRLVEELSKGALSSILLLDPDGNRLWHGAAPSVPKSYIDGIDGATIGPVAGSCGTAAYLKEPVIVADIAQDPLWADYRDLALPHGLRACWSTPVLASDGRVLGTFAIYFREPGSPTPQQQNIIEQITDLASIAIERKRAEDALRKSESYLAEAQKLSHTGSFGWRPSTGEILWSEETFRIFQHDRTTKPTVELILQRVHPEDAAFVKQTIERASQDGKDFDFEHRLLKAGGSVKYVHIVARAVSDESGGIEFVGSVMDVTERIQAEDALRQAHADLAHVSRVTAMGELTASLAHEVNQPITAAITNANSCLRWLAADTPNIEEARAAVTRILNDGTRASEIIKRIRLLFKKGTLERALVDVNEVIREMIVLLHVETMRYSISVRTELAADLPQAMGDRVQLQQVMMNLIMNSIDAMKDVDGTRELTIKSQRAENDQLLVSVSDTGVGLPPQQTDQIFSAFFTTKLEGTGMGLRISRSIVESHGGRLWAADNSLRGASFYFTLSTKAEAHE